MGKIEYNPELIVNMRKFAKKNPLIMGDIPEKNCHQLVEIDGNQVHLTLTYNIFPMEPRKMWQLSIVKEGFLEPLPDDLIMRIAKEFLGDPPIEVKHPELPYQGIMRHFAQIAGDYT